jgi:predicted ATP-grasp superfamily ATP-dependent carboligase
MLGIAHPEVRLDPPNDRSGWLCKRAGAAGGGHVRRAGRLLPPGRGWYWQRRVAGEPVSALIVGNGRHARLLALGRQITAPRPGRPFRFAGVLAPHTVSPAAHRELEQASVRLAEHYRLHGLASVDTLVDGHCVTVLELNPRTGGSLDAHGTALGVDLFALHVAACRGGPLPEAHLPTQCAGSLIAFADRVTRIPAGFIWPDWAADRSPPVSVIPAGGPICTVLAQGAATEPLSRLLWNRAAAVRAALRSPAAPCGKPPLRYDGRITGLSQAAPG